MKIALKFLISRSRFWEQNYVPDFEKENNKLSFSFSKIWRRKLNLQQTTNYLNILCLLASCRNEINAVK